jgi:hypothetical protein
MADHKMVEHALTQIDEDILGNFPPEILLQSPDIYKV